MTLKSFWKKKKQYKIDSNCERPLQFLDDIKYNLPQWRRCVVEQLSPTSPTLSRDIRSYSLFSNNAIQPSACELHTIFIREYMQRV